MPSHCQRESSKGGRIGAKPSKVCESTSERPSDASSQPAAATMAIAVQYGGKIRRSREMKYCPSGTPVARLRSIPAVMQSVADAIPGVRRQQWSHGRAHPEA